MGLPACATRRPPLPSPATPCVCAAFAAHLQRQAVTQLIVLHIGKVKRTSRVYACQHALPFWNMLMLEYQTRRAQERACPRCCWSVLRYDTGGALWQPLCLQTGVSLVCRLCARLWPQELNSNDGVGCFVSMLHESTLCGDFTQCGALASPLWQNYDVSPTLCPRHSVGSNITQACKEGQHVRGSSDEHAV